MHDLSLAGNLMESKRKGDIFLIVKEYKGVKHVIAGKATTWEH